MLPPVLHGLNDRLRDTVDASVLTMHGKDTELHTMALGHVDVRIKLPLRAESVAHNDGLPLPQKAVGALLTISMRVRELRGDKEVFSLDVEKPVVGLDNTSVVEIALKEAAGEFGLACPGQAAKENEFVLHLVCRVFGRNWKGD